MTCSAGLLLITNVKRNRWHFTKAAGFCRKHLLVFMT